MRRAVALLLCLLSSAAHADGWTDVTINDAVGRIGPNHPLSVTVTNPSNGSGGGAAPITGQPTVSAGNLSSAGSVLAAEASGVTRLHVKIWNFAASGGASLYCTDDGSTPTTTNASFIAYAQGGYERDTPGWVPSGVIQCAPSSGTVPYRAESYP